MHNIRITKLWLIFNEYICVIVILINCAWYRYSNYKININNEYIDAMICHGIVIINVHAQYSNYKIIINTE